LADCNWATAGKAVVGAVADCKRARVGTAAAVDCSWARVGTVALGSWAKADKVVADCIGAKAGTAAAADCNWATVDMAAVAAVVVRAGTGISSRTVVP
jgi:hypothetical protein